MEITRENVHRQQVPVLIPQKKKKITFATELHKDIKENLRKFKLLLKDFATITFNYEIDKKCSKIHKKIIKNIISGEAKSYLDSELVHSVLLVEVVLGNEKLIKRLINKGINVNQKSGDVTALQLAVKQENYRLALKLIKYGADINQLSAEEKIPLLAYALNYQNLEIAEQLIDSKNINVSDANGDTLLHHAVKSENGEAVVQFLVKKGADINKKNIFGISPLSTAINEGRIKGVQLLLEAETKDVNERNPHNGDTLLHQLFYGFLKPQLRQEMARLLILKGADINAKNEDNFTPLHIALREEEPKAEMVDLLLKQGARVDIGSTLLTVKLIEKSPEIAQLLIKQGVDIDQEDEEGNTLLHQMILREMPTDKAGKDKEKKVIGFLIENGANIEAENNMFQTPLTLAIEKNKLGIVALLIEKSATLSPDHIHCAIKNGNTSMTQFLKRKGAELDAKDKDGKTPLQLALEGKQATILSVLLDTTDSLVFPQVKVATVLPTYINQALLMGNREAAKQFIERDSSALNTSDKQNQTPLHHAITRGSLTDVLFLLAHGANINTPNTQGTTPLEYALNQKPLSESIIFELLNHGAKIEENMRFFAFQIAFEQGNLKLADAFLKLGADINTKVGGQTLLHEAVQHKDSKAVSSLILRNANTNIPNSEGNTPLHIAVQLKEKSLIGELIKKANNENRADVLAAASKWHKNDPNFMGWLQVQFRITQH